MKHVWYIYNNGFNIGQAATKEFAIAHINREAGVDIRTKGEAYFGEYTITYGGYLASYERIKE